MKTELVDVSPTRKEIKIEIEPEVVRALTIASAIAMPSRRMFRAFARPCAARRGSHSLQE